MGRSPARLWCKFCGDFTPCRSVSLSEFGYSSERRFYDADKDDINWFRRMRECDECSHEFLTAEVDEYVLCELVALRDAVREFKEHAYDCEKDAKAISKKIIRMHDAIKALHTKA